jgi:hypothetical protein
MYEVSIDAEMLLQAIKFDHFTWLQYLWAFGKNWLGARRDHSLNKATQIDYMYLFRKIKDNVSSKIEQEKQITKICEWRLDIQDDMLKALLSYYYEGICLRYMGVYGNFIGPELYKFALTNNNTTFMKGALLAGAFDKTIFMSE